jgi:hypothetical protein
MPANTQYLIVQRLSFFDLRPALPDLSYFQRALIVSRQSQKI